MRHITLSEGWQLKALDKGGSPEEACAESAGWLPARVPGTVHEALLEAGQIPDPFYGLNEQEVQWVGERAWLYRCAFELPTELPSGPAALCCDGLDTVATVWLNDVEVLASDNMFVPQRVALKGLLRPGRNELRILFESAQAVGRQREAERGPRHAWNGNNHRVYLRKAQYHFGWDWGPVLVTAGPWQPVRLEFGTARIAELHCPAEVAPDLGQATLPVTLRVAQSDRSALEVLLRLHDPSGALVEEAALPLDGDTVRHTFSLRQPRLWWPNGHGAQPLYRLSAVLRDPFDTSLPPLDTCEQRLGLRRLRLVQEPLADEPGQTFLFEVNNTPIFCGGANWIPADSLTTRITPERYREWIALAAGANMTMLRIWGGGIYEAEVFYDLCDEHGLLVWQDFMFACGMYPADPAFQASVRAEAEAQVRRLRHHACIALWCGNNEDYAIAESIRAHDPDFEGDPLDSPFPARAIYERLLPDVCAALDPTRTYWPGSPYGGRLSSDQTVGDRHTWDVWHGAMAPYQDYGRYEGRFVSEFGMQSCPARATLDACLPPEERYPQSRAMDHHNKASDGPRRLAVYLNDTLRANDDLDSYVYATQLMQSEALAMAYRVWRRRWAGPGRYAVAGALVWQINDCWPVTSWAIVDYERRAKPAYYSIRRELAPLALGLAHAEGSAAVWAVNATPEPVEAELLLQRFDLAGALVAEERRPAYLPARQSSEQGLLAGAGETVLLARLLADGEELARATLWPEPLKYLYLPDPLLTVERLDGDRLRLSVARPAKGLWLEAGDGVAWSDNALDLLPGDPRTIAAPGLGDRPLRLRWVGGERTKG
ncbi:MAG TPA: glycoside hydrolase family 2 protein [Roseiflexaceae bacterium]|nr:glycoside hydrolase family 2 protein [Roseiflexaceae bacterium]